VKRTHSRGRHRQPCKPEDGSAVLLADAPAAADPQTRIRATPVAFYGRTAHAAGTWDGQAGRHRQLALCRSVVAAYSDQVTAMNFDESCRAVRVAHTDHSAFGVTPSERRVGPWQVRRDSVSAARDLVTETSST
jgi:hypothetical protein